MADITKIKLPDGTEYNLKDATSGYITSTPSYTLSINQQVITLSGSDSSTTSINLPVYDGAVMINANGVDF